MPEDSLERRHSLRRSHVVMMQHLIVDNSSSAIWTEYLASTVDQSVREGPQQRAQPL